MKLDRPLAVSWAMPPESPVILDLTLAEFELATSLVVLGGHFLAIHEGHPAPLDDAAFKERVAVAMRPSPASKTLMRKIVAATIPDW